MWGLVCIFAIMSVAIVISGQEPMSYNIFTVDGAKREASQSAYENVRHFEENHRFKSPGRPHTEDESHSRPNMDSWFNWMKDEAVSNRGTSEEDKLIIKGNSLQLHRLRRPKRQIPKNESNGYTCYLYLLSDPLLWRYAKDMSPQPTVTDILAKKMISTLFSRHVRELNEIFLKTTFNTQDNRLSYRGINFKIARTKIMTDVTEKCGDRDATPWCNSSTNLQQVLQLLSKENYDDYCLVYIFTHRVGILGLSYMADLKAEIGGICNKFRNGFSRNTGIVNLYKIQSTFSSLAFAHEVGHSFGSAHDRGSCLPAGEEETDDSKGNFLMNPKSVFGTKERNDQFSPCSRDIIARILDMIINERYNRTNCLTKTHITLPFTSTSVPTSTLSSSGSYNTSTSGTGTGTGRGTSSDPKDNHWTIGLASTVIVLFVCLSVVFPYILWRRRVVFLMKLVHRFQTYEDNDEREFDAFISYRSTEEDEHFVVHTLFPKLEKQLKFKICVHFRDFMPGETIANNIIWGVESSRRTILILTPSYIESEFCRFEYQRAQHEMLKQKQRIIPIILKDISSVTNDMDETLRTILGSITYIQWPGSGDQRKLELFWDKLLLSMPKLHRNSIQMHRNSGKIDDFELTDLNAEIYSNEERKRCVCACV